MTPHSDALVLSFTPHGPYGRLTHVTMARGIVVYSNRPLLPEERDQWLPHLQRVADVKRALRESQGGSRQPAPSLN